MAKKLHITVSYMRFKLATRMHSYALQINRGWLLFYCTFCNECAARVACQWLEVLLVVLALGLIIRPPTLPALYFPEFLKIVQLARPGHHSDCLLYLDAMLCIQQPLQGLGSRGC